MSVLYICIQLWRQSHAHTVLVAWSISIGYYLALVGLGFHLSKTIAAPSNDQFAIRIISFIYIMIDDNHVLHLLAAGMMVWAALFWPGRIIFNRFISKYGIQYE